MKTIQDGNDCFTFIDQGADLGIEIRREVILGKRRRTEEEILIPYGPVGIQIAETLLAQLKRGT